MPYSRRGSYRRRRSYRRRPRSSGGGGFGYGRAIATAGAALAVAHGVKALLNVEFKHRIGSGNNLATNTGVFLLNNGIGQGDDNTERVGRSIKLTSLLCRFHLTINALATNTLVRMIIFWDRQSNGATPATTDILESANVLSGLNKDQGKRFYVIFDRSVTLDATLRSSVAIKCYKKLHRHTEFISTASDITGISSNAMWFFILSNEATNTPTVLHNRTVRYIDN